MLRGPINAACAYTILCACRLCAPITQTLLLGLLLSMKLGEETSKLNLFQYCNTAGRSSNVCTHPRSLIHNKYICRQRGYKQGKGKQFNKPRATLFSKKKELSWVGFEPTTLCFLGISALPTVLPGQLSR